MPCTVVSIYPIEICEHKPGLIPSYYTVPKGTYENPSTLVVSDAKQFIYRALGQPPFISFELAEIVAKSIVNDYIRAKLEYSPEAHPGLMYIPDVITADMVKFKLTKELKTLHEKQTRWFVKLVELADDEWNKTRQRKRITDIQKFAADQLKLKREWYEIEDSVNFMDCPACMSRIRATVALCPNCKVIINEKLAETLRFAGDAKRLVV